MTLPRLLVLILVTIFGFSGSLPAQTHVVSPADLQKATTDAATARQHSLDTVNGFLSSPKVDEMLAKVKIDPAQVKTAVSTLDDEELARLAARSERAQADLAAGRLTDRDLIIILLGIAALILIIVAVR
jgi:hypothetical protein